MRRQATPDVRATALLVAALTAQGCNLIAGLDDVKFEGTGGSGGATATQGGGGSAGGTTSSTEETSGGGGTTSSTETASATTSTSTGETTTSTSSTTATGPVVQCNYPQVSDCEPGEVCCFDKSQPDPQDFCGAPGSCQPSSKYAELACENDEDCPGELCCMYFVLDANLNPQWQGAYCDTSCDDDQEARTCQSDADCTFPMTCDFAFSAGYPTYKVCMP